MADKGITDTIVACWRGQSGVTGFLAFATIPEGVFAYKAHDIAVGYLYIGAVPLITGLYARRR